MCLDKALGRRQDGLTLGGLPMVQIESEVRSGQMSDTMANEAESMRELTT